MQLSKEQAQPKPRSQAWLQQHERSSIFAIRVLVALTLALGRTAGRVLVFPVAAYFLMFVPAARGASRRYLSRMLGREPRLREIFRHFYTFACVSLDRMFLLKYHFTHFEINVYGEEILLEPLASGRGRLMIGGHLGSFEALRVQGLEKPVCVNLVMYEDNARNVATVCKAIDPELARRIIPLGRVDSMLRVAEALDRGEWVGVLADRALESEGHHPIDFLGSSAPFPLAPFRMAAMLRHEVVFMVALYKGGNRYDLHFEKLIDAQEFQRRDRAAALTEWAERYARVLERYCKQAPYNWFNFYDFWDEQNRPPVT